MIDEAELRQMTPAERRKLATLIAEMDYPHPLLDLKIDRRHKIGAVFFAVGSVVLIAWIVVLVLTLHRHFTAHYWRLAWVGFDFLELIAFVFTGWAFWRGRQIVIACLLITGTLLCCDAWFDVILDLKTPGMWVSVGSALIIELPLAFLLFNAARRLLRMSALAAISAGGVRAPMPSLWKLPLASLHMPHPHHAPDSAVPARGDDPSGVRPAEPSRGTPPDPRPPEGRIHGDQGLADDGRRS